MRYRLNSDDGICWFCAVVMAAAIALVAAAVWLAWEEGQQARAALAKVAA